MAITVKNSSEMFGKDVFTNKGAYCGRVSDLKINMEKFRMQSLVLDVAKGSFLSGIIGGKKGIIVPYQYVDSVGDVIIIKHISTPVADDAPAEEKESATTSIL
ncbi:MAG: PRC-barrel domain-containing protein [Candidatus Aenigmatarchaeota archaeon]